jgi:hypothetical protein
MVKILFDISKEIVYNTYRDSYRKGERIMKIVINACYGGFGLKEEVIETLGTDWYIAVDRDDARLVEMVEKDAKAIQDDFAELKVVEIPDEATDWEIDEYDGLESVTYVVNGKIHHKG